MALTAAVLIGAAACARPDEIPPQSADDRARIAQLAGDLRAAAEGRAVPGPSLAERLDNLCRFPPAEEATRDLAGTLAVALPAARMPAGASERFAAHVYGLMNGGYLRRHELEALTQTLASELEAAGVPSEMRSAVRRAGVRVAREERNPRGDWW